LSWRSEPGYAVVTVITERARALSHHDSGALVELARRFDALGVPYQAARTMLLSGRAHRDDVLARIASL
jgi:hypothetical protein